MLLLQLLLLPLLWAGSLVQDKGFHLEVQESVTVQEGLCVFVPCNVTYPQEDYWQDSDAAHSYWFRAGANTSKDSPVATNNPGHNVQKKTQNQFYLLGDPRTYNCSLDIRDARKKDEGKYFFRVDRGKAKWNYISNLLSVHVMALTNTPHILIPNALESGHPRNLTCSVPWACERGTPPIFSWTSSALTSLGPRTLLSSVITLTPQPQDHGTNLTCQVKFPGAGVTVESTIRLNVTYAPQNPKTGELGTRARMVQGAVMGAGVTALFVLCLFLIYFIFRVTLCQRPLVSPVRVKTCRKKAAKTAVGVDIHPVIEPASLSHQQMFTLDSQTDSSNSAETSPPLGMEQELHYASITFHRMNPPQKGSHTANSEIRTK